MPKEWSPLKRDEVLMSCVGYSIREVCVKLFYIEFGVNILFMTCAFCVFNEIHFCWHMDFRILLKVIYFDKLMSNRYCAPSNSPNRRSIINPLHQHSNSPENPTLIYIFPRVNAHFASVCPFSAFAAHGIM